MRSKYLSALAVLLLATLALSSCGGDEAEHGTSDTADTPTNGVSQSTDKADAVAGSTDGSVIPGVPDVTTTTGSVSDMPNTDKPVGDGVLESDGSGGRDTADNGTAAVTTAPPTTAPPATAPAVRPPEGK